MSENHLRVGAEDMLLIQYRISCAGIELESNESDQAISYQMGQGMWPVQLELAMINELSGAILALSYSASDAVFGEVDPARVVCVQLSDFQQAPQYGELIEFKLPDGEILEGQVLSVHDDQVEVDFNHPYAGRDLDIRIQIKEILPVTGE